MEIVKYSTKYNDAINQLDLDYWGPCGTDKASDEMQKGDIIRLALEDGELIGLLHFKPIGDLLDCYHILVADSYQRKGVATKLFEDAFLEIRDRNFKSLVAHAVEHEGKVNALPLLQKFGFLEIYRVTNYWSVLEPLAYCKQCQSNHCHCGVVVFLKKME